MKKYIAYGSGGGFTVEARPGRLYPVGFTAPEGGGSVLLTQQEAQALLEALDDALALIEGRSTSISQRDVRAERDVLAARVAAIARDTEGHPGLALIYHTAIGTHDAALAGSSPDSTEHVHDWKCAPGCPRGFRDGAIPPRDATETLTA